MMPWVADVMWLRGPFQMSCFPHSSYNWRNEVVGELTDVNSNIVQGNFKTSRSCFSSHFCIIGDK
jgi:hypothetical protein